jgi:hypothetical protein
MTEQYAIIDEAAGHLVNVVLWDGNLATWQPPTGTRAELLANVDLANLPPAPAPEADPVTAEEHLESVGLGGNRQPTLLYLRQAGAVSAKLDATEAFLNTVLAMFAADPAPRSDWPAPAYTFEETVTQAVQSLSQPSEPSAPSANFA